MTKQFIHNKVLIAPLDWGLGHATRCIPVIQYLEKCNFEIIIASSGDQAALLKKEFPHIICIHLDGYKVTYSRTKRMLPVKILFQVPKIMLSIFREQKWLKKIIREFQVDLVISDNRYGLYASGIPCIFITHQLLIKASYKWLERLIQKINYRYISHFSECWVPDCRGALNIAGELSHPQKMPVTTVRYIGPLSRFNPDAHMLKKYDYLFLLSGPEPQRSILEQKIIELIALLDGKAVIVRGKPNEQTVPQVTGNCIVFNHLETKTLQDVLLASEFVIGRPGYTTVMEILSLQKKTILIPTPGQTEQEYLAKRLMQQHWCYCCNQADDLLWHINKAFSFEYELPSFSSNELPAVVNDIIKNF